MRRGKKILFAVIVSCLIACVAVCATACGEKNNTEQTNADTYAVTYNLGEVDGTRYGGTSVLPNESDKKEGEKFKLASAPVWDGYVFKGWSDGENVYNAGVDYTMPKKSVTLTATWEKYVAPVVTYAVTYDLGSCNGTAYAGSGTLPTESEKEEGETLTLALAPVWDGYNFLGWSDGENVYDAGVDYTMPNHEVTLTATWEKVPAAKYSVTYSLGECNGVSYGGATKLPTTSDKSAGAKFRLASAPVWSGHTFLGWSDGENVYDASYNYTMPDHALTITAQWQENITYSVTYALGSCGGIDYAGSSALPAAIEKEEGAKFNLASALVWNGYTFLGWSDGESIYDAGAEFVMSARSVTLTAQWYNSPEGLLRTNVEVPAWEQDATTGGYEIERGQYVRLSASFDGKGTSGTEWAGIVCKIYKNCIYDTVGTFYQFRPDFAVDRRDWSNWQEDNRDFNVTDTNWNKNDYISLVTEADVVITVALSEEGVLTYTIELTSSDYSYTRVFSPKNTTMISALVIFGADGVNAHNATLVRPMPDGVKLSFDWGYDGLVDLKVVDANSTYTFGTDAIRDGYLFLGWQLNGKGDYYKSGDTYSVGNKQARFVAVWEADEATPGLQFTELSNGTYSVKKGTTNSERVVIPRTHNNKPVTEIGSMAFYSATWLKQIVIPDTVVTINGSAFYGTDLQEVYIPDSVKTIGSSCFKKCTALVSVRVPSGLKSIGTDAFANCSALQLTEANNALYIGNDQNSYVVLVKAKDTAVTQCAIESGCEYIYDSAFNGCTALQEVTFPATLRIIGGKAFNGCRGLTSLVIPDNVTGIAGMAFGGCSGLQSITIPFVGGGDQAGGNCYPFGYIFGGGSYTGGTKTSQEYPATGGGYTTSFYYIPSSLTSVTVAGGALYYGAFKNCSSITTIKLPASVKSIPKNAFNGCYALTDVYYDGTQAEWQKVTVEAGNDPFTDVSMHYKEN